MIFTEPGLPTDSTGPNTAPGNTVANSVLPPSASHELPRCFLGQDLRDPKASELRIVLVSPQRLVAGEPRVEPRPRRRGGGGHHHPLHPWPPPPPGARAASRRAPAPPAPYDRAAARTQRRGDVQHIVDACHRLGPPGIARQGRPLSKLQLPDIGSPCPPPPAPPRRRPRSRTVVRTAKPCCSSSAMRQRATNPVPPVTNTRFHHGSLRQKSTSVYFRQDSKSTTRRQGVRVSEKRTRNACRKRVPPSSAPPAPPSSVPATMAPGSAKSPRPPASPP